MSIETVALKLPTFWTTCPSAWFAQTEAQFALRGISADETKYYHVVAALDAATASRSLAVISSSPPTCKYSAIKSFLINVYGLSEAEKAAMLLDIKELGDSKPSEVMDKMLALLEDHRPCFLFRHIFLRLLPEAIRAPLANSSNNSDYRALAKEADNLYNSLTRKQPIKSHVDLSEIDSICWFHRKFGSNARRCTNPCKHFQTFKRKGNQGNGRADLQY
ncbi:retrovirus-related pol polyprotein [Plakobranchus ocellatus]|uniref:Retrovirus-related pol polyprotein n=1 Tax=Plakobranchus ocellatus TaxID=259542 RepID=A0AAV3ZLJ8_9GAST|nr:retrovirus-related pol polyprotein [Plakobranchus ocellatus]